MQRAKAFFVVCAGIFLRDRVRRPAAVVSSLLVLLLLGSCGSLADPYRNGGVELVLKASTPGMEATSRDQLLRRSVSILQARLKDCPGAQVTLDVMGRIVVRAPLRLQDAESILKTNRLEFHLVRTPVEVRNLLESLDAILAERGALATAGPDADRGRPLSRRMVGLRIVRDEDLPVVMRLLAMPGVDSIIALHSAILWGDPSDRQQGMARDSVVTGRPLYVVDRQPEMSASGMVARAQALLGLDRRKISAWGVSVTLTPEGRAAFSRITGSNVGRELAIVIDSVVTSTPVIREQIAAGDISITGDFSVESAKALAAALSSDALPVTLAVEEQHAIPRK